MDSNEKAEVVGDGELLEFMQALEEQTARREAWVEALVEEYMKEDGAVTDRIVRDATELDTDTMLAAADHLIDNNIRLPDTMREVGLCAFWFGCWLASRNRKAAAQ